MRKPLVKRALALVSLTLLAGCAGAQPPWKNPDLPKEQWSKDWSACKRLADREVMGYRDEPSEGPFKDYDRAQAKRQMDAYVRQCMVDRGYVPARPEGK